MLLDISVGHGGSPKALGFGIGKGYRQRRQDTTWNSWPGCTQGHVGQKELKQDGQAGTGHQQSCMAG